MDIRCLTEGITKRINNVGGNFFPNQASDDRQVFSSNFPQFLCDFRKSSFACRQRLAPIVKDVGNREKNHFTSL